jgi:hypothetical protein
MPGLVADGEPHPPERHDHERDQRIGRERSEAGAPGGLKRVEQRDQFGPDSEQDQRMGDDESDRHQRELAVEVVDDVLAPWRRDIAEARSEPELKAHHGEAGVAECGGKFGPEIARRRQAPEHEGEQRREDEGKIDSDPNRPARGIAEHSLPPSSTCFLRA